MEELAGMPRRKREIYQAISTIEGWVSRNQIADTTGKRKLSPNDVNHLDALVREDLIELKNVGSAERPEYRYRVAQEGIAQDV